MKREKGDDYAAKETVIRIELFMGSMGEVLDWRPGLEGQEVMQWKLRGGDYAKALGQVEII